MKNSLRLLGKELREILRTYKIYTIPGIFLLFGFASPILTKLLPEMLGSMMEEMGMQLPEQTWLDSYGQLFKNLVQMGILAVILTTMGTIADERNKGVAQLVLTKPVSRTGYILAKYAANLLLVGISALLAFLATWFYTDILFEGTQFGPGLAATGLYILYAAVILAVTIFSSAITKSTLAAGGLSILGLIVISLLPLLGETLHKYSPGALTAYLNSALTGTADAVQVGWAVAVAAATILGLLGLASFIFHRQEL
ncbi:MAG: ABC transporter permease [Bacillota bacterium]|jgi:ABC-2 type transport system permease protein